jgi:hypothetical protein
MTPPVADRIDVLDDRGRAIGWVDPRSGVRNLIDEEQATAFDEMVDFWLSTSGVESPHSGADTPTGHMTVQEVRFPDPPVIRSLLIPLRPLR